MERQKQIWLYGNSVILGTIGASLRQYRQFKVIIMVTSLLEAVEKEAVRPDAIIFDLNSPRPKDVFLLLESCPGLKIIGISPDSNIIKVWSERQMSELSTRDLLEVIAGQ